MGTRLTVTDSHSRELWEGRSYSEQEQRSRLELTEEQTEKIEMYGGKIVKRKRTKKRRRRKKKRKKKKKEETRPRREMTMSQGAWERPTFIIKTIINSITTYQLLCNYCAARSLCIAFSSYIYSQVPMFLYRSLFCSVLFSFLCGATPPSVPARGRDRSPDPSNAPSQRQTDTRHQIGYPV